MCVFCQIIERTLPGYIIYEDDYTLAFLDIKPVNPGDILVVTKKHYRNMEEAAEEDLLALMKTIKKMGVLLKDRLGVPGYNISENNDPVAGQLIPHLHFHIIPRHESDNLPPWPQTEYQAQEAEEILKKLLSN